MLFFEGFSGVLSLPSCFASFAELGPLLNPCFVVLVATRALTNCVPRLCFLFLHPLYFLLYPSLSIDVGATTGVFSLFSNRFLLCDHGLDL